MSIRELLVPSSITACVLLAACSKSNHNPSQPTAAATTVEAEASNGSVTVPHPVSPAAGATIRNADQPVTLVVTNAVATKGPNTYDFEVATDTGFASKVGTKTGIAEGGGRTTVTLDRLPANADYY